MSLPERVLKCLRTLGVGDGHRLGAAVSGGADSIALLHLLALVRRQMGVEIHVLHVDHGLRVGSAEDADFVSVTAAGLGLGCAILAVDVHRPPRTSPEAAARQARYAALEAAADDLRLAWIATAHTRDDQAETLLLRLLRGTGVDGLAGIAPVRGRVIRPLLDFGRDELRAWLEREGLPWREDPTNTDLRFERNWVRGVLLPLIADRRPGAPATLARLASHARADRALLDALSEEAFSDARTSGPGVRLGAKELVAMPEGLATRVVRRAFSELGAGASASDVDATLRLLDASSGTAFSGAPPVEVWRLPDGLLFLPRGTSPPEPAALPASGAIDLGNWGLRVRVGAAGAAAWGWRCPVGPALGGLAVRSRKPGDRVPTPRGTRKVQDVLVDAKVPRPLRDHVPVLVAGDDPLAVVGLTAPPVPSGSEPGPIRDGERVVVDADPLDGGWLRELGWWSRANAPETS